jgi:hypothetical protein
VIEASSPITSSANVLLVRIIPPLQETSVSLRLTPKFVFNLVETVDVGLNGTMFSIVRNEGTHPRRLFSLQGVFEAADGVLNLALNFVGLAIRASLALPAALPTACLTAPLISFADPSTRSLSMISSSKT